MVKGLDLLQQHKARWEMSLLALEYHIQTAPMQRNCLFLGRQRFSNVHINNHGGPDLGLGSILQFNAWPSSHCFKVDKLRPG